MGPWNECGYIRAPKQKRVYEARKPARKDNDKRSDERNNPVTLDDAN